MTTVKTYLLVLSLVAMAAAALAQGLAGAMLTPVLFVMVATLTAAAIVAWTRKPLPGLIVAAWLSLGPIFMPYADNNLRDGIAAYRDYRRRQQPLPAPATEPGPR